MNKIKVAIIDDHAILRDALAESLCRYDKIELLGKWATGEEALNNISPDGSFVALVDFQLPGMDGISLTRKLKEKFPSCEVVILSAFTKEDLLFEAFQVGVAGYLSKDSSVAEVINAIRTVDRGQSVIAPGIAKKFLKFCSEAKSGRQGSHVLNDGEIKILELAKDGFANKEIGGRLGLSLSQVKSRFRDICKKLDARDRVHAVVKAIKMGLLCIKD